MTDNRLHEIGCLTLDKIFFESYYPILFTCLNENNEIYLCVCCNAAPQMRKWLVTKVSSNTIIKLLKNDITIRDAFLMENNKKFTIVYSDNIYSVQEDNKQDWDAAESIYLPTEGEFIDAEEDEYMNEIKYFKKMNQNYDVTMEAPKKIILSESYQLNMHEDIVINNYLDYNTWNLTMSGEPLNILNQMLRKDIILHQNIESKLTYTNMFKYNLIQKEIKNTKDKFIDSDGNFLYAA